MACPKCKQPINSLFGWQRRVEHVEIDGTGNVTVIGHDKVEPPRVYMCPVCAAVVAQDKRAAIEVLKAPSKRETVPPQRNL